MAYAVINNSPTVGYIAWSGVHIVYKGVDNAIANGNSNKKYIWWDYSSPTVFQLTDSLPTLADDDVLVFFNKNGTHLTVPNATVIDGGLIVPESILAAAIAADTITGAQILAGSISSAEIAAGAIGAAAIAAGVITTDHLSAAGISADKIMSGEIDTNLVQVRGNTNFYWDGDYIYIVNPDNVNEQIRLSKEGIRFTQDGGTVWNVAIGFDGIKMEGKPTDPRIWYAQDGQRIYNQDGELVGHLGYYQTLSDQIAAFVRASTAYKQNGTLVASGVERYEYSRMPGPVWQDLFATDLLASEYTSGGDAVATWAVTGGKLTGTGGTQATLIKNDLLLQDLEIEVNCDQAENGGIVARYQDRQNYYLLPLCDDSGANTALNLRLYKRVAGTFIELGTANVTWARGASKLTKFTLHGSLLEVWFDGIKVISVTDTTFTGGGVGLRNASGTAIQFLDFKVYVAQQGVVVEEGTTNLLTANQSNIETSLDAGYVAPGGAIVRNTAEHYEGVACIEVVCSTAINSGCQLYRGAAGTCWPTTAGLSYTGSFRIKGYAGVERLVLALVDNLGHWLNYEVITLTKQWQRRTLTGIPSAGSTGVYFSLYKEGGADAENRRWWMDTIQIEQKSYATSWQIGGTARNAEVIAIPTAGILVKGQIDLDLIYTPTTVMTAGNVKILWRCAIDANNYYYLAVLPDSSLILVACSAGTSLYVVSAASYIVLGNTYHITGSLDGAHIRLLCNGAQIGADTDYVEPAGVLPANMYLGSNSVSSEQVNGIISNFRISNIARTLAQHLADYNTGRPLEVDEHTTYLMPCDGNLDQVIKRFGLWSKNSEITLVDPPVNGGIRVYDDAGDLRCHIGQYAVGKYGAKIIDGEIYSSLFRTGAEGATSYISLEDNELKVYEAGLLTMKITCQEGGHGYQYLYEGGVNTLIVSGHDANPGIRAKQGYMLDLMTLASNASITLNTDGSIDIDPTATDNTCTIFGNFAVTGAGKGCIVETKDYGPRWLYAVEAPDIRLEQKGAAQMVDGSCRVDLNPIFLQTIEADLEAAPWVIDTTPYFDAKLYISEINSVEGWFMIKECSGGLSAGRVAWSLSAVKIGCIDLYIPEFKPEGDVLISGWEDEYIDVIR